MDDDDDDEEDEMEDEFEDEDLEEDNVAQPMDSNQNRKGKKLAKQEEDEIDDDYSQDSDPPI